MASKRIKVRTSTLQAFLNCRELCRLSLDGWEMLQAKRGRLFGSLIHEALDHFYKKGIWKHSEKVIQNQARSFAQKFIKPHAASISSPDAAQMLETMKAQAEALIPAYFKYWHHVSKESFEMLETESEGSIILPLPKGFRHGEIELICHRDGLFIRKPKRPAGKIPLWVLEHKTSSRIIPGEILSMASISFQNRFYHWMTQREGKYPRYDLKGVCHEIIRTPELRQGKKESYKDFTARIHQDVNERLDHYFFRIPCPYSRGEIREFEAELNLIVQDFARWLEGDLPHYRNSSGAICAGKFTCEYLEYCSQGLPIESLGLYRQSQERKESFHNQTTELVGLAYHRKEGGEK